MAQAGVTCRVAENNDAVEAISAQPSDKIRGAVIELRRLEVVKKDPLTAKQRSALVSKYRLKARKLGRSILRAWHSRLDLEEVDSVVDLSLCEAVKRFDPTKGASFMTFLYYHLKGNLVRAVSSAANSHSIPLFNNPDELPEAGEGEHFMGYQFRTITASEVSEALAGVEAPLPDEVLWKKEIGAKSQVAFERLDVLEREIIQRIFICEEQIMDIARDLGYSRCHVSRVKKRALDTLYDEMCSTMKPDEIVARPTFDEEEESTHRAQPDRRIIQRRRPRSKAVRAVEEVKLAAVA